MSARFLKVPQRARHLALLNHVFSIVVVLISAHADYARSMRTQHIDDFRLVRGVLQYFWTKESSTEKKKKKFLLAILARGKLVKGVGGANLPARFGPQSSEGEQSPEGELIAAFSFAPHHYLFLWLGGCP